MTVNKPELLAPAGSEEAFYAAVQNGADAVYIGGQQFSARQYAENFNNEVLCSVVRYAHLYGVRVYAAVNTLIDNSEISQFVDYLYTLYESNVDAIIIQDLGAALAVRTLLPDLELHASTQMTIHNSAGVRFLEKMGFSRAILAREVSLKDISLLKQRCGLPLETFVHGALCVSYSGQCLMSSMIGGRSGNRGRCAQPCRLTYTLVRDGQELESTGNYLLSTKDLNMFENISQLCEAGISSLKVEGRMKSPEYVAIVIHNYRQAIDAFCNSKKTETDFVLPDGKELRKVFNRDYTTGYFLEKPGQHLMGYQRPNNRGLRIGRVVEFNALSREVKVCLEEPLQKGDKYEIWVTRGGRIAGEIKDLKQGNKNVERIEKGEVLFKISDGLPHSGDRVFKVQDAELIAKARESYLSFPPKRRIPLSFDLKARLGQAVKLRVFDDKGNTVQVESKFITESAQKYALTPEMVSKQLDRLGNTVFCLDSLKVEMDNDIMVPLSELNNLRRDAVALLEKERLSVYRDKMISCKEYAKRASELMKSLPRPEHSSFKPTVSVTVGDMDSLLAALEAGAGIVYFGGDRLRRKKGIAADEYPKAVEECHKKGAKAVLLLPRINAEEKVEGMETDFGLAQKAGVDGFLAGNPGTMQLALERGLQGLVADYTLNVFNDLAVKLLLDQGVCQIALSPELTLEQIRNFKYLGHVSMETLVHGNIPLMITEHCPLGNLLGKGHLERGCPQPCRSGAYGLKDRMGMVFPLESDENCRAHIFNPKVLNTLSALSYILGSGINVLRIEGRKEEPAWIKRVVRIYVEEVQRWRQNKEKYEPFSDNVKTLQMLAPQGITMGHYFRGVQ